MELEDYTKPKARTSEAWLKGSGVLKEGTLLIPYDDLIKILTAYRGYIYEAEFKPEIHQTSGEEIPIEEL